MQLFALIRVVPQEFKHLSLVLGIGVFFLSVFRVQAPENQYISWLMDMKKLPHIFGRKRYFMKKFLSVVLMLVMVLALVGCGDTTTSDSNEKSDTKVYSIGISQYGEHPSLDNCRTGFMQGLEEAGLVEGTDYTVDYQNAGFDDNIAIQIGQNFSANDVDLMVGIATPAATACFAAAEDKDIPVVFNAITSPEAANLVEGNVTGISDALPVSAQLDLIRALQPEAKTIGILYTLSEQNSVAAIAEYEAKALEYGFIIEALGVTSQSEVTQACDTLIVKGVDCFSNLTDNNVVGVLASVLEKTNAAGIPVYGSEVEQVKIGCVASAGIDYVKLGAQCGKLAAKILRGETTAYEAPYETVTEYGIYINSEALSFFGIEIPEIIADVAIESNTL